MAATMMTSLNLARPATGVPAMRRNARAVRSASRMVVRAEGENKTEAPNATSEPMANGSAPPPDAASPPPPAPAPAAAKAVSIGDLMAFSGPAPELINGRLAMLGFVAALGAELATGETVVQQLEREPTLIALTFVLFAAASLVPMIKGKGGKVESGPFTKGAEMINGRAAMIGFAALLVTEAVRGAALF